MTNLLRAVLFLIVSLLAHPLAAQTLGQAPDDPVSIVRVFFALLLCLALAVAAAFALRGRIKGGGWPLAALGRKERRLHLIEALRLSHQVDLCFVQCDGDTLLMATSAKGVQILRSNGKDVTSPPLAHSLRGDAS